MKFLVVGDPHVKPDDIEECRRLATLIKAEALANHVDKVVLMGDLHHTHSLVYVEVMRFWRDVFADWKNAGLETIALVGNHDRPADGEEGTNALIAYGDLIEVIEGPTQKGPIAFLPYIHEPSEFLKACKKLSNCKTLYCHATFVGARYDNGFYAKEGIEQDLVPVEQIISGHIHTQSEIGKVFYVGAPRWQTVTDANQDRAIWVVEHDADGSILNRIAIPTDDVCSRIMQIVDTPDFPVEVSINPNWRYVIDIKGPAAWVHERKAKWQSVGRVRTFVTDKAAGKVRESDGIGVAFRKYFEAYQPKTPVNIDELRRLVEERLTLQ